jgi:7-carboxy-7-deazaguanine synthase
MCDSLHAVLPKSVKANAEYLTQEEIFDKFKKFHGKHSTSWVTFSGGNPCIHNLTLLVDMLTQWGFSIAVETQGTFCPYWLKKCAIVTVSPKGPGMGEVFEEQKFRVFLNSLQNHPGLNVKVVVFDEEDLKFASMVYNIMAELKVPSNKLFLSQGNPYPPGGQICPDVSLVSSLQRGYLEMWDKLSHHPILSRQKYLPQFHVWLWGNRQGV